MFEKALEKAGSPCKGAACKSVGLKALQGGCKGRPTDTCSPLYMRPCQDGAMRGGCVASVEQVRASLPSTYYVLRTTYYELNHHPLRTVNYLLLTYYRVGAPRAGDRAAGGGTVQLGVARRPAPIQPRPYRSRAFTYYACLPMPTNAYQCLPMPTNAYQCLPMPTTNAYYELVLLFTTVYYYCLLQATTARPRSRVGCTTVWRRVRSMCCSGGVSCRRRSPSAASCPGAT